MICMIFHVMIPAKTIDLIPVNLYTTEAGKSRMRVLKSIRRLLKLRKFIKFEILKNDDLFNKVDILGYGKKTFLIK